MLRHLKQTVLETASYTGFLEALGRSQWRRNRLLILCYHGISSDDEHVWNPELFIPLAQFRSRMEYLRRSGCGVLPLSEALRRLQHKDLPDRSVVVTFDDGWRDFHDRAAPVLADLGIPATVYLSTYYVDYNRPVFDPALRYILWKSMGRTLLIPSITNRPLRLDEASLGYAFSAVQQYVERRGLTARGKDDLLARLADSLGFNYSSFLAARKLHLMNADEVQDVARRGIDVELHTHSHRVPLLEERLDREINRNRESIARICGRTATHFCYPSGENRPEFGQWLKARRVTSATTCAPALCTAETDRFFLPRFLDNTKRTEAEFAGWVNGMSSLFPQRQAPRVREVVPEFHLWEGEPKTGIHRVA